MNKKYFLYVIMPVMVMVAVGGAVYADSTTNGKINSMSNLVLVIATKFNLNVSDVQAVFDEQNNIMKANRQQNQAEMASKMKEQLATELSKVVADGKLTQVQADLITAKKEELQVQRTTQKTREEIQTQQDALKQWASDNNIPEEYLNLVCGGGMGEYGGYRNMGKKLGF